MRYRSRAAGAGRLRIMFTTILPNCMAPLIVVGTVQTASAISLEATLSFLGVGLPQTEPSIGVLIANGFEYMLSGRYWISTYPGLALLITIVSINLVGDRIRAQRGCRFRGNGIRGLLRRNGGCVTAIFFGKLLRQAGEQGQNILTPIPERRQRDLHQSAALRALQPLAEGTPLAADDSTGRGRPGRRAQSQRPTRAHARQTGGVESKHRYGG